MYNHMRNQTIDLLDQLSGVRMEDAPNYKCMLALRDSFVYYGVPKPTAEQLVATMKISVSEQAVNDSELMRRVCETYGVLVGDMYRVIKLDFESSADHMLVQMAGQMSVQMEF